MTILRVYSPAIGQKFAKMFNELVIEHFGFAPAQFVDEAIEIVNSSLFKVLVSVERAVENELGVQETSDVR